MRTTSRLSLLALVFAAACGSDTESGLVVGALIDQTGSNSETSWVQAAQLAVRQVNDALDAEGATMHFVLNVDDSENNPDKAQGRAIDLVNVRGAHALIADTTQVTESIGRAIYGNQIDVPVQCSSCESRDFLNPAYVNPGDTQLQAVRNDARGTLFRTSMSTDPQAYVAFDILSRLPGGFDRNNDGFVKFELYGSDEAYGHAAIASLFDAAQVLFANIISAQFVDNKLGIEIVFHDVSVSPSKVDYERDIRELSNTNIVNPPTPDTHVADYIIMASFAGNAASFREVYAAFLTTALPPVLYFPAYRQSNTLAQLGVQNSDNTVGISSLVTETDDAGQTFADDFRKAYGFEPHYGDAAYFDNAVTLMLAAVGAGRAADNTISSAAIRAVLPQTSTVGGTRVIPGLDGMRLAVRTLRAGGSIDYAGASGPMNYDSTRSVANRMTQFTAQAGVFNDSGPAYDCVSNNDGHCGINVYADPLAF